MEILEVDLLAFETGDHQQRRAVIDGVMRSLETGFVYVAHDLSETLLDDTYGCLESFFALPQNQKSNYVVDNSFGQSGYTGLLVETAASSDAPDWKEMLNWGAPIPDGHPLQRRYPHRYFPPRLPEDDLPGSHELLMRFHERVFDLQRRFLRIIAAGLGTHAEFFEPMIERGATLTRAIHYPAMEQAPGEQHVWAAEHGDINLITALPRATASGLQVKTKAADGEAVWIDAAPPEGRAILNSGMMMEHLSNGRLKTGIHRVVAGEGQTGDRISVVQFSHPTPWTILSPLPSCVTEERPLRFPGIAAADWVDEVLWSINLIEDSRRVE